MLKYLKYINILLLLLYLLLALRSDDLLSGKPLTEDGYFTLTIARNIAEGNGISADGKTLTNGFQPLFTFLLVPIFVIAGNDNFLAIRFVWILSLIIYLITGYLISIIVSSYISASPNKKFCYHDRDDNIFWLVFTFYFSSYLFVFQHFNGLETGLVLLIYCVLWRYLQIIEEFSYKILIRLGIISGILVLTRIDNVFMVILLSLLPFFLMKDKPIKTRFISFIIYSACAFLISLPWWLFNYLNFGSIMPSSGSALTNPEISLFRIKYALSSIFQIITPFTFNDDKFLSIDFALVIRLILIILIVIFTFNKIRELRIFRTDNRLKKHTIYFFVCIFIVSAIYFLYYSIFNWAVFFYTRYFMPLSLIVVFTYGIIFSVYIFKYKKIIHTLIIILVILNIFLFVSLFNVFGFFNGSAFYKNQFELIKKHVKENELVAAGQTGTLGYFRKNVINLDGKVNPVALSYRNNMNRYLDSCKIKWFCDWKVGAEYFLGKQPVKQNWVLIDSNNTFFIYEKKE